MTARRHDLPAGVAPEGDSRGAGPYHRADRDRDAQGVAMSDDPLAQALAGLAARHPEVGPLDERARGRLAEVLADPDGEVWMERAGLLDGDSCGYPVTGGYYDVKSDLGAATTDPAAQDRVLAALRQDWADDYVLTGRARLDRPWREHLPGR